MISTNTFSEELLNTVMTTEVLIRMSMCVQQTWKSSNLLCITGGTQAE